ncbi:hypothetical protein PFFCH_03753 [Plasmodium falciparum FCH/4]|uniref:Plasmodium RESA N-terminal domain-containing protein n=1 Tax=Plasmodium falciparum FCH/4 TaxID=1036724 RepID=A0A024VKK6_PLAFA|nr:hypothetical protein PFFCH_03753 [Plasmodium falciparum FCH/4]
MDGPLAIISMDKSLFFKSLKNNNMLESTGINEENYLNALTDDTMNETVFLDYVKGKMMDVYKETNMNRYNVINHIYLTSKVWDTYNYLTPTLKVKRFRVFKDYSFFIDEVKKIYENKLKKSTICNKAILINRNKNVEMKKGLNDKNETSEKKVEENIKNRKCQNENSYEYNGLVHVKSFNKYSRNLTEVKTPKNEKFKKSFFKNKKKCDNENEVNNKDTNKRNTGEPKSCCSGNSESNQNENENDDATIDINYNDISIQLTKEQLFDVLNSLKKVPPKENLIHLWNHTLGVNKKGLDDLIKDLLKYFPKNSISDRFELLEFKMTEDCYTKMWFDFMKNKKKKSLICIIPKYVVVSLNKKIKVQKKIYVFIINNNKYQNVHDKNNFIKINK